MTVETPVGLQVDEGLFLTHLSLRLDPVSPAATAVEQVLGCPLPTPCTFTSSEQADVLWQGPDEFLILAPTNARSDLPQRLRAAIGDEFASVIDVSAQRTTLRLSGPLTQDILARGCAIDLDPRTSPAGTCVQTLLAQTGAILLVHAPTSISLLVRPSFAPYLAAWLTDACTEYRQQAL